MISVIVPVYNSERYLSECLKSIVGQSYREFEVIVVDDGSTDSSFEICNHYAQMDSRVKVVHQKNGGSTSARKTGLRLVEGKYILFVDSDDWIDTDCIEKLSDMMEKTDADIVVSGYMIEESTSRWIRCNKFKDGYYTSVQLAEEIYPRMLSFDKEGNFGIIQYLSGKLLKKSVIEPCIQNLDERIYDGEDVACVYDACLRASSIVIDHHPFYHYRIHQDSVCRSVKDERYFANAVYLYQYLMQIFDKSKEREIMIPQLKYFIGMFMNVGMKSVFKCGYQISNAAAIWRMPDIPTDKMYKLAIFGAGTMGISYYKQLLDNRNIEITAWVDSISYGRRVGGIFIAPPEVLKDTELDYVLIAARKSSDREEIIKRLEVMGIAGEKMLYRDAERYSELYEFCMW